MAKSRSRIERERRDIRRDIVLIVGVVSGCLAGLSGLVLNVVFPESDLYPILGWAGGIVFAASGMAINWFRFRCPECNAGRLKPIASPGDQTVWDGDRHKLISQYYVCNRCGHREWIEHD